MSSPHDPLDELAIPDGTTVEEHDVVTDGDVLIGSNSQIGFGVRGRTIAAGERVRFGRQIEADGDCRLDIWCDVAGSVLTGQDAYIGERTKIGGKLLVSGDLDIGDDVTIEEGFDANGWIVTRNPVPVLVFYFIVLSQFLRIGDTDKADEFANALAGDGIEHRSPLVIPRGAEISDDAWRVSTPARIGDNCRLHGNIRAESIAVGTGTTIFGSLRARGDIEVGAGTVVIGDVTTRGGTVTLQAGSHVRGDVSCGDLVVHEGADVDGTLRARGDMKLVRRAAADSGSSSASASQASAGQAPTSQASSNQASPATDGEASAETESESESVVDAESEIVAESELVETESAETIADAESTETAAESEPEREREAASQADSDRETAAETVTHSRPDSS